VIWHTDEYNFRGRTTQFCVVEAVAPGTSGLANRECEKGEKTLGMERLSGRTALREVAPVVSF
jgi:hypothetical protein